MRPHAVEDGVSTEQVEARTDAGEFERRPQEGLAQALAVRRVVAEVAVGLAVCETDRAVHRALVHELDGEQVALAEARAVLAQFLVDHAEAVARLDVEHEVDIPAEDVGDPQRQRVAEAGIAGSLEQRITDDGLADADRALQRVDDHRALETAFVTSHLQRLARAQLALEADELRVAYAELQQLARAQPV